VSTEHKDNTTELNDVSTEHKDNTTERNLTYVDFVFVLNVLIFVR
jgi:hypothetical protein